MQKDIRSNEPCEIFVWKCRTTTKPNRTHFDIWCVFYLSLERIFLHLEWKLYSEFFNYKRIYRMFFLAQAQLCVALVACSNNSESVENGAIVGEKII